jgi:nitrite reductase/ring-hydroxylating ferredoxin subunit
VRVLVGPLSELPPGSSRIVPVGRHGIGVFNVDGALYALTNRCPHMGAPLCRGPVTGTVESTGDPYSGVWAMEGRVLRCPWHSWEFDITSGRTIARPLRAVRTFPVVVEDGQLLVEVPASVVQQQP